eukprot:IDg17193t1
MSDTRWLAIVSMRQVTSGTTEESNCAQARAQNACSPACETRVRPRAKLVCARRKFLVAKHKRHSKKQLANNGVWHSASACLECVRRASHAHARWRVKRLRVPKRGIVVKVGVHEMSS